MKRLVLSFLAGLGLLSCSQGSDEVAGTIGTGNTAGVAGVAISSTGAVAASSKVYVYAVDSLDEPRADAVADANGAFRFDSLPTGKYLVFVDQNGQFGMLSDTLDLKAADSQAVVIKLQPYTLVNAGLISAQGYCGVSANPLFRIDSAGYWRVPHVAVPLRLNIGGDTSYSVRWDSAGKVATLSKGNVVIAADTVKKHAETGLVTTGTQYLLNPASAWYPQGNEQLHIGMAIRIGSGGTYPLNLASLGDSTSLAIDELGRLSIQVGQASGASVRTRLTTLPLDKLIKLDWVIDRASGSSSVSANFDSEFVKGSVLLGSSAQVSGTQVSLGGLDTAVTVYHASISLLGSYRK